jgi:phage gpG-like protein
MNHEKQSRPHPIGAAMSAFTLVEFAAKLLRAEVEMKIVDAEVIRRASEMVCAAARDMIGVPQPGWPALSAATLAHKIANTPLLESGEMKASISWNSDAHEGYVGSNNPKLRWHEFGTNKEGAAWGSPNPPRPVLALASVKTQDKIYAMAARAVMAIIGGGGIGSAEWREFMHVLREFRDIAHEVDDALTPDDQKGK